jgi:NAD(P)-dependent dehydrogenase (short-subunit alcohol dehydrogenase family)
MPEKLVDGKAIVVTGATRGLGRAFARALADAGAKLVINGRDAAGLEGVADDIRAAGGAVVTEPGTVMHEAVAERLIARCVAEYGAVDVLVNNAGIVRDRTLLKMTPDEFDDVIAVNLRGTWSCGRHAALAMRDNGGGAIVNIISNAAFHGSIGQNNYAASKAGAIALMRAWSFELARYGIRVNSLWPVAVTDMTQVVIDMAARRARAEGRPAPTARDMGIGTPDEVAPAVVFLASDRSRELNAQVLSFNGRHLAVWTHPAEAGARDAEVWTAEQIAGAFANGGLSPEPMNPPAWLRVSR